MANPFGTGEMAAGYAKARPAVHPRVLGLACAALGRRLPFRRALDVGCGAGLSTQALAGYAEMIAGVEPAVEMLRWAARLAPGAHFAAGGAEQLPFGDRAFDLLTAAGSLNYVDLGRFFPEAARVLERGGALLAYDFSPGRRFAEAPGLEEWFARFQERYPPPAHEALPLDPAALGALAAGFRPGPSAAFETALRLEPGFYLESMLTETNVAAAVRRGAALEEIRRWCAETLAPVWQGRAREVVFTGYYAWLHPA